LCESEKATCGRDSAMRAKASSQRANSVASLFRNLRRAGVLKYRSSTSIAVPAARAAGSTGETCPASQAMRQAWPLGRRAAHDPEAGDGTDRGERLAAETQRGGALQVRQRGDLAGREAGYREGQVVGFDAAAVVDHADAAGPAFGELDRDALRARVEAVLHQLLEGGRGAVDDLARRDLVDEELGKRSDAAHIECYTACQHATFHIKNTKLGRHALGVG
jgi:hypothetical protein